MTKAAARTYAPAGSLVVVVVVVVVVVGVTAGVTAGVMTTACVTANLYHVLELPDVCVHTSFPT